MLMSNKKQCNARAKSGDLDNRLKISQDALKGICFEDDRQIVELHAFRFDDKANPRIEIEIKEIG